jgi:hypothetical protein
MSSISDLKGQLAGKGDKYVNQLLQQAWNAFDDVRGIVYWNPERRPNAAANPCRGIKSA